MKKIDMHHHLVEEAGYAGNLLREMDKFEIEKLGLIGMGKLFKGMFVKSGHDGTNADDNRVEEVVNQHPGRFFGFGYIRCGVDTEAKVSELHQRGFKGLKFHIPKKPYNDKKYFPIYAKAQELSLPCLFHCGIINMPHPCPEEGIASGHMRPIHLEEIAQTFPELKIIIAHMGVQDYLTTSIMLRLLPNVYADLSGTTPGWRAYLAPGEWLRLLWFPHAPDKIMFGSDVHFSEFAPTVELYDKIMADCGWDDAAKRKIYHGNAWKLFSL